jgi:hypothetical protein
LSSSPGGLLPQGLCTGRLCSFGSRCCPVPRRHRSYAALRLPHPLRPWLRSPLASGLPWRGRLFCAEPPCVASAGLARIHRREARRRWMTGSPLLRVVPRKDGGLPGYWTVLLLRAVVVHRAGCVLPSPISGQVAVVFEARNALDTRDEYKFPGCIPHGPHLRAPTHRRRRRHLRRKARYRLGGLTLRRAGFAPAGRQTEFHELSLSHYFRTSLAWSHCASYPPGVPGSAGSGTSLIAGTRASTGNTRASAHPSAGTISLTSSAIDRSS